MSIAAFIFPGVACSRMRPITSIAACAMLSGGLARGDVQLQSLRQYPSGLYATGVIAADINGDGHPDLVLSNRGSNDVTVRFNNGAGYFPDRIDVPTGNGPRYVDGGDFDGDGDFDLCTPDYNGDTATVLRNDGGGHFTITHQFELNRTVFLWTDDIDLDGAIDIVVLQWDGSAETPSESPALMTPFYGTGTGDFKQGAFAYIGLHPRGGASADFNGDGIIDLVTANLMSADLTLLLGQGDRTWAPPQSIKIGGYPRYLTLDDFDGDGDVDIAAISKDSHQCLILHNDGNASFDVVQTSVTNNLPHSIDSGDLDQDGDIDLVVCHVGAYWSIAYFNDGSGHFPHSQEIWMPTGATEVHIADMNTDGKLDIISANINAHERGASVLLNGSCDPTEDCNANGILDGCEAELDCDLNGIPDECELADGTAFDIDGDGVIDVCQLDCNGNGAPDEWEVLNGIADDCDGNIVPDECDWPNPGDCDGDGIINGCEDDLNHDLIPDECQCYPDLDYDGDVDVIDLLEVLNQWGPTDHAGDFPPTADFDQSDEVDIFDFLMLLNHWGPCPPPLSTETGACCSSFGPCFILGEITCELTYGTYLGDGTTCDDVNCDTLP